jgi:FkbM family methyltransferase
MLKGFFMNLIPEFILGQIKKIHYVRLLKKVDEKFEKDFRIIKHLVESGDKVIDIGANIGVYTKYLSGLVGKQGLVYSIEPIPCTYKILYSNFAKMKINNVEFMNYAISNSNGTAIMEVPTYESGYENFYRARIAVKGSQNSYRRFIIKTRTIDFLFSQLFLDIAFIKCDVEGHEFECIKGAMKLLNKFKPAWLIEISGNADDIKSNAFQTMNLLFDLEYKAFWYDGKRLIERKYGNNNNNFFFLDKKHLKSLINKNINI